MKNLEKFNAETTPLGTELITRNGREVTEWYYFKTHTQGKFPIIAIIEGNREHFSIYGKHSIWSDDGDSDLFIKPKFKECWVNVYEQYEGGIVLGSSYLTKEAAINNKDGVGYIKTIRITDEPE